MNFAQQLQRETSRAKSRVKRQATSKVRTESAARKARIAKAENDAATHDFPLFSEQMLQAAGQGRTCFADAIVFLVQELTEEHYARVKKLVALLKAEGLKARFYAEVNEPIGSSPAVPWTTYSLAVEADWEKSAK